MLAYGLSARRPEDTQRMVPAPCNNDFSDSQLLLVASLNIELSISTRLRTVVSAVTRNDTTSPRERAVLIFSPQCLRRIDFSWV